MMFEFLLYVKHKSNVIAKICRKDVARIVFASHAYFSQPMSLPHNTK